MIACGYENQMQHPPKDHTRLSVPLLYTWPRAPLLSSVSFIKRGSARRCTLWADDRRPWAVRGPPMMIPQSLSQVGSQPEQPPARAGKPHPAQGTSPSHTTTIPPLSPQPHNTNPYFQIGIGALQH